VSVFWGEQIAFPSPYLTSPFIPVYTIQPIVKPVWQLVVSCIQTFNWLSNPFDNRFDNRLYRVYSRLSNHCTTRFDNRLNEQWLFVRHSGMNSCSFNTVVKPVWQPAVSCKSGISVISVTDRAWLNPNPSDSDFFTSNPSDSDLSHSHSYFGVAKLKMQKLFKIYRCVLCART